MNADVLQANVEGSDENETLFDGETNEQGVIEFEEQNKHWAWQEDTIFLKQTVFIFIFFYFYT